ncbi:MAG: glycoside hydrolase family 88 protein [Balneolaceae bacterium]
MNELPEDRFPRSYEDDSLITSNSSWWCSGFYPGTLLHLYEETGDEELLMEVKRKFEYLEKEQYNTDTHDLGFMMFDSFGHAHRINPNPEYEEILINSAKSLASRYSPEVKSIRSWNSDPGDFLVIIDNMMNLDLLFWAAETTGDSSYYNIAVTHANTTLQNHFREDNSSWHVLNYDPETGEIQNKRTEQGLNDESAWARGQAWGLYGFTETYGNTGDQRYLDQAVSIAEFLINQPNLPEDKIPLWDFDAETDALRDASAAAIMASALLELDSYVSHSDYYDTALIILENLTKNYIAIAKPGENGNFILKHGVGHLPANSEVDVPLTYADYYFIEALRRL